MSDRGQHQPAAGATRLQARYKGHKQKKEEQEEQVSVFVRIGLIARSTKQMSGSSVEACANCGKGPSEAARLKNCTACRLVKYCSVDCQRAHRKQHKGACKKRAAELKDERLYTQGLERPEEDFCPICTLPIQIPTDEHSLFNLYCMKKVCHGCVFASWERAMLDYCPFCRFYMDVSQDVDAPVLALVQKHVDANELFRATSGKHRE